MNTIAKTTEIPADQRRAFLAAGLNASDYHGRKLSFKIKGSGLAVVPKDMSDEEALDAVQTMMDDFFQVGLIDPEIHKFSIQMVTE